MTKKKNPDVGKSKIIALEELHQLKKARKDSDKKTLVIKDISKVLKDIEESKKLKKQVYFSTLLKKKVLDSKNTTIGCLKDLAISGGDKFPEVSHLLITNKKDRMLVSWRHVSEFGKQIKLDDIYEKLSKRLVTPDDILLGEHILDKQVVDVNGLKVVRVNDISLAYMKNKLAVINIEVGTRSIMRRLGIRKMPDILDRYFKDRPVAWNTIEPLTKSLEKIHLKVPCPRVSDLHPADIAELFEELSLIERKIMLRSMKADTAAEVLLECEPDVRKSILRSITTRRLALIFEKMPPNDAANLLSEFGNDRVTLILKLMKPAVAIRIQEMFSFKPWTIARYMSESYFSVDPSLTVEETMSRIRSLDKQPENFHFIYVVDDIGMLKGVLSLKQLIMAKPASRIADVMITKVITVDLNYPIEYVEDVATKYDLIALPVVDINDKMRGIVSIVEILDMIVERTRSKEPFELTDDERSALRKDSKIKRAYSRMVKDVGQFVKEIDTLKTKNK